jgi:hypothetical protein
VSGYVELDDSIPGLGATINEEALTKLKVEE